MRKLSGFRVLICLGVTLTAGACGDGEGSTAAAGGGGAAWCEAMVAWRDSAQAFGKKIDPTEDEIDEMYDGVAAAQALAPDGYWTGDAAQMLATLREQCGDAFANGWAAPPARDEPADLELLIDDTAPFQVAGSSLNLHASNLCPARNVAVALRSVADGPPSLQVDERVDEDGELAVRLDLPADLAGGTYVVQAEGTSGQNEFGRDCPAEQATTAEFTVRARASSSSDS